MSPVSHQLRLAQFPRGLSRGAHLCQLSVGCSPGGLSVSLLLPTRTKAPKCPQVTSSSVVLEETERRARGWAEGPGAGGMRVQWSPRQGGGEETPFLWGFPHSPFQPHPSGASAGRCHPGSERPASLIPAHLAPIGTDPCPSAPCRLACAVHSGTHVLPQRGPDAEPPVLEGSCLSWAQSPSKRQLSTGSELMLRQRGCHQDLCCRGQQARPGGAETWVRGPHRRGFASWWG